MRVVEEVLDAREKSPGRVHFVLGNHDHGHVGGPHTRKFHRDEVAHLEESLKSSLLGLMIFAATLPLIEVRPGRSV